MKKTLNRLFSDSSVTAYLKWMTRNRYLIIVLSIIVTAVAFFIDKGIGVDSSIMGLLPENTPSILRVKALEKKTGGLGDLIVMIESQDRNRIFQVADELRDTIRKLKWVDDADYRINDSIFMEKKLLFLDTTDLRGIYNRVDKYISGKKQAVNPLFVNLMDEDPAKLDFSDIEAKYSAAESYRKINISKDGGMLLLVIHPKGLTSNMSFARSIYSELKTLTDNYLSGNNISGVKISVGGTYKNRINEYDTIIHDLASGTAIGVALILIILLVYFKRVSLIICVLLPLVMSEAWTFAITVLSIGNLNLITAFLIIILFGLGIDFGIHMTNRYMIMRKEGLDHLNSLRVAIQTSGRASLTSGMTIIVSFYMLTFSNFLGFRHFGFIAGTGILLAYIGYMLLLPVFITVADDIMKKTRLNFGAHAMSKNTSLTVNVELTNNKKSDSSAAWIVLAIIAVISVISIWKLSDVAFEYDFRNLRSQIPATREFNQKMRQVFSEARDPAAILVSSRQDAEDIRQHLQSNNLIGGSSPLEKVRSIDDLIPECQPQKLQIIKDIRDLIDRNAGADELSGENAVRMKKLLTDSPLTINEIPPEIRKLFLGKDGTDGQLVYLYQRESLLDLRNAEEFADAVGTINLGDKEFHAISEPLVYVDLIKILKRDSVIAIIGAFLIIAFIVWFDFGSVRATVIILLPLCIGILWMLGIMGFLSMKLSIFNMVILPSILGLGVDAAVHIYHRFKESGCLQVRTILMQTGGPNVVCTLINLVGFGGIITANHPGLRSIGELAIIGMSTCLVASLSVIAAIIVASRKKTK